MRRPLHTIKKKGWGGWTSLLKERLLKQSLESSYDKLHSHILTFYLSFLGGICQTRFGESCAGRLWFIAGVSERANVRGADTQGRSFSRLEEISMPQGIRLISHFSRFSPIITCNAFRREWRQYRSNALCWQLEEADSNECLHDCSLSCSTPAHHMCFWSGLINKHFSRYGCLPLGDLLLHLFSLLLSPAKKNSSAYYYVKLCLWKHTSAPLSRSPSPERAWLNCAFRRGGWRTALIGARCVPHVPPW